MSAPLVAARGLAHAFGAAPVLRGVDLALEPGRFVVVAGPNGAGKTTLLRALSGVLRTDAGEVALGGRALAALSRREIAQRLAVVPQDSAVPFPFSVREMVALGRAPFLGPLGRESAEDRARTERALAALELAPLAQRAYATLSGGEKRRVLLARALAQGVGTWLLDEPTAHMDLGHGLACFSWLRAWLAEDPSRGIVLVTHDLALAARFADELVLLDRGSVAARGAPAEVLTAERLAAVYGVEARVERDAEGRLLLSPLRALRGVGPAAPGEFG
ncbi:MAG TPA: ABC transporter ATP-binding protein [Myxococcota bacterium]|nr:ABC transporter ATP-binding protein [Myxococcota bacterium]